MSELTSTNMSSGVSDYKGCLPLGYRVLVRPDADGMERDSTGHYKSKGGIVVVAEAVDKDRARQVYGTIVAIGPRAWHDAGGPEGWGVKVGDKVSYAKYGGAFIEVGDERLIVLNDEDIITKVI